MKVSIITVTYNNAKALSKTIESVLHQTYADIDYWIIDGNSTDNSVDVIKLYEPQFYGRLHWISEPDKGIYNAMNKGITHCTGDVVGFLNADDWFTSDIVVEKIAASFTESIDAVYGDIHSVAANPMEPKPYKCRSILYHPFLLRFGIAPPHPSFYVRKTMLEKYGAFDDSYRIAADFDLIARLIYKYHIRCKYIPIDFVTMTRGGTSTKDQAAFDNGLKETFMSCKKLGIKTGMTLLRLKKYYAMIASRI